VAKAWDPAAAASAAVGVAEKAKGDAGEAAVAAEGAARESALAKTRGRQLAPTQQIRKKKCNQTHKRKVTIMPGGDQTGPMGQGPMTGRGAGYCAGYNQPGWMNRMLGRWLGRGPGGGRGWGGGRGGWGHRHGFHATGLTGWQRAAMGMPAWNGPGPGPAADAERPDVTPEQELAWLQQQASQLEAGLAQIRKHIAELTKVETK